MSSNAEESSLDKEAARLEIERLVRELAAAQQERSQSAAYGLELLNEKENLQQKYDAVEADYEQAKLELKELREAWSKAVSEQRVSATTVFEKEVQLMNDSDALAASFTQAKHEIEKDLKQTKTLLDTVTAERDRFQTDRDELSKRVETLEQERKNLRIELKELKSRETKLLNENSELEEENVSLQKQVSSLRSTQVEFESSKHEIQRLQDDLVALNSQLEEMVTLKRISERKMEEAYEALESEREQKYALRKELDKRNSADPSLINWTSLAALKGSPHLANLALQGFDSSHRASLSRESENISPNGFNDTDGINPFSDGEQINQGYGLYHDLEMPSIEGSLFDEVHLTQIKKLQRTLDLKESERSNLNTRMIEMQHELNSKIRQADELEKKLTTMCSVIEEFYNTSDIHKLTSTPTKAKQQQVTNDTNVVEKVSEHVSSTTHDQTHSSTATKSMPLDDFDNVYSHLQTLFSSIRSYQELVSTTTKSHVQAKSDFSIAGDFASLDLSVGESAKKNKGPETILQSDDVNGLKAMLYHKHEQLKQLRSVLKSNKESAEVALGNLKSKYEQDKLLFVDTMHKLRQEHRQLKEDAATFTSLRAHFSSRIEEYNAEIEKLQSKLAASEHEKNTLSSILRMAIEQKIELNQKIEALEMDRDQSAGPNKGAIQPRGSQIRGRGSSRGARNPRQTRLPNGGPDRR